jgi:hypothetical protein
MRPTIEPLGIVRVEAADGPALAVVGLAEVIEEVSARSPLRERAAAGAR